MRLKWRTLICPCARRNPIYAIVRTGGKQYRVEPQQTLDVERLPADVGSTVDLGVLLLSGEGGTRVGTPLVEGARVIAEVIEHGRGKKLLVFKYKNKTRYRRRHGHRQDYTRLEIKQIVTEAGKVIEEAAEKPKAKPRRAPKPKAKPEPEAVEAEVIEAAVPVAEAPEVAAEAPAVEVEAPAEAPKPARRARAPKAEATAEGEAKKPARKPRTPKAAPAGEDKGD